MSYREAASDKVCLNHFVTEKSYRLAPPHTDSWRKLYRGLVPIFGVPGKVQEFSRANTDWAGDGGQWDQSDLRHLGNSPSVVKIFLEKLLDGWFGGGLEKFLKFWQVKRIKRSLRTDRLGYAPRIRYGDEELEFHPDRAKFDPAPFKH